MTLTEIDELDVPDALSEEHPPCEVCGEDVAPVDAYGWCSECREDSDPSPMCNCGMCADGEATCIRQD